MEQIMEQEGITEELKSRDQMEWVRRANNARSRVDEIILNELVYVCLLYTSNKDFRAFRYGDHLEPGHSLKIEHSITCEQTDLSSLIAKGEDALLALRKDSMDSEQTAFEIVVAAANQWEKQAAYTQNLNRAIEYLRTRCV